MQITVTFPEELYDKKVEEWQKKELKDHSYRITHYQVENAPFIMFYIRENNKFRLREGN
jgi:hypothetical protein